ncbi:MAG: cob(I)yrinic acid a,c-diamide adenosyltransferase [Culturomica sp.]|jgi:ATP:cob(I)alamin adenosyltransferase|nr:cob(I)yrinic acid a,c-diamide adenosyltransferase [Culturomica sp.]
MRIYTRSGDKGKTGIHGGERVDKDHIRIEANGCIDELNSMIGVVRSFLPPAHEWQELLFRIQSEIMVVMSHVATPSGIRDKNPNKLDPEMVSFVENRIDDLIRKMDDQNDYFILPGGTRISAHLHLARTVARRSERRLWTLNREDELPPVIVQFMNRLSDLFFVMARYEMLQQDYTEERWRHFLYKKGK